jgi:hypothetical protein
VSFPKASAGLSKAGGVLENISVEAGWLFSVKGLDVSILYCPLHDDAIGKKVKRHNMHKEKEEKTR